MRRRRTNDIEASSFPQMIAKGRSGVTNRRSMVCLSRSPLIAPAVRAGVMNASRTTSKMINHMKSCGPYWLTEDDPVYRGVLAMALKIAHPKPPTNRMNMVMVKGDRHVRIRDRYSLATIGFHNARETAFIPHPPKSLS